MLKFVDLNGDGEDCGEEWGRLRFSLNKAADSDAPPGNLHTTQGYR
jgi:hypothetical protein